MSGDVLEEVKCACNGTAENDDELCFPLPLESGHDMGDCIDFRRSVPILNDQCDLRTLISCTCALLLKY